MVRVRYYRKGSLTGPLPMLILVISIGVIGIQAIQIAQSFDKEVTQSFNDLEKVSETKFYGENYFYDYIVRGAEYAVYQKTYDLGKRGGGVEWTWENLELMTTTEVILHERANKFLEDNYAGKSLSDLNCNIEDPKFNILLPTPDQDTENIASVIRSDNPDMMAKCGFGKKGVTEKADGKYYLSSYNSSYDRYLQMAQEAQDFFRDLRKEWKDADRTYTARTSNCGSFAPGQVATTRQQAIRKADRALRKAFNDAVDGYPTMDQVDFQAAIKDTGYDVNVIRRTRGECDCKSDCEIASVEPMRLSCTLDCKEKHIVIVEVEPEYAKASLSITDQKYRIPTESGWNRLKFVVDPYTQRFESGSQGPSVTVPELDEFDQTSEAFEEVINSGLMPDGLESYLKEVTQIYEGLKHSEGVKHEGEDDGGEEEILTFNIELGHEKSFGDNSLVFFSADESWATKLFFSSSSGFSEGCGGDYISISPVSEFPDARGCTVSGVLGGGKRVVACSYSASSDTAKVSVGDASLSKLKSECSADTGSSTGPSTPGGSTDGSSDTGAGDDGSGDSSDKGSSSGDGSGKKPTKRYDIYFLPMTDDYGQTKEYRDRADDYFDAVMEHTPIGECGMGRKKVVEQNELPDKKYDMYYVLSQQDKCNAKSDGGPTGRRRIVIHNGLPEEWEPLSAVHELGHEYGLCDVYLKSSPDPRSSSYDNQMDSFPGGCGNPYPEEWGWTPSASIQPDGGSNLCQSLPDGSDTPAGTCGADLDHDESTRGAGIMGGGGAFESLETNAAGEVVGCGDEVSIEQKGFTDEAYKHFKDRLAEEGFQCK